MTNDHLTDEILQAYLFEEMQDDAIASHISVCKECRKKYTLENMAQNFTDGILNALNHASYRFPE